MFCANLAETCAGTAQKISASLGARCVGIAQESFVKRVYVECLAMALAHAHERVIPVESNEFTGAFAQA